MKIEIKYGLPFVQLEVNFRGKKKLLDKVLLDTGSAGTIFNANMVVEIGVVPEENAIVDTTSDLLREKKNKYDKNSL